MTLILARLGVLWGAVSSILCVPIADAMQSVTPPDGALQPYRKSSVPSRGQVPAGPRLDSGWTAALQGRFDEAAGVAQAAIDRASSPFEVVQGYRLRSHVAGKRDDVDLAVKSLDQAIEVIARTPGEFADTPWIRASLEVDRAQVFVVVDRDDHAAIDAYQRVLLDADARPADRHNAMQNCAMLLARVGKLELAIKYLDQLATDPVTKPRLSGADTLRFAVQRADWLLGLDRRAEAFAAYRAIWDAHPGSIAEPVLDAGAALTSSFTLPNDCDASAAFGMDLLSRVQRARASLAGREARLADLEPAPFALDSIEHSAWVAIANTRNCPGMAELAAEASIQSERLGPWNDRTPPLADAPEKPAEPGKR